MASPLAAPPWKYRSQSLHTSDRHSSVSGTNPDGYIPAIQHQPKFFAGTSHLRQKDIHGEPGTQQKAAASDETLSSEIKKP